MWLIYSLVASQSPSHIKKLSAISNLRSLDCYDVCYVEPVVMHNLNNNFAIHRSKINDKLISNEGEKNISYQLLRRRKNTQISY